MLMHFGSVNMFQVVWESHLFQFVSIKIERGLSVPLLNRPVGPSSTNSKGSFQMVGLSRLHPLSRVPATLACFCQAPSSQ